jgi:hypothetical protein
MLKMMMKTEGRRSAFGVMKKKRISKTHDGIG